MARVNMTRPDNDLTPGVDLWVIDTAQDKNAKTSGAPMLALKLVRESDPAASPLYDNLMLSGKGWRFTKGKLRALGYGDDFDGEIDAFSLAGKRIWVATKVDQYEGNDGQMRDRLVVDVDGLRNCGFQAEHDVPPGHALPNSEPAVDRSTGEILPDGLQPMGGMVDDTPFAPFSSLS